MTILALLIFIGIVSIIYGVVLNRLAFSPFLEKTAMYFMRFFRVPKFTLQVVICWIIYLMTGIIAIILATIFFGNHLGEYRWSIKGSDIPIILLGFIAQSSVSALLLLGLKAFKPTLQWDQIIWDIGWIRVSEKLPSFLRVIYPMSSSLVEEILFRCVFYSLLRFYFSDNALGLSLAIMVVSIAFCVEQVLNTQKLIQALAMGLSSLFISIIGCLMIEVTGSFLPAIITHMAFAMFYTQGYRPKGKPRKY